MYYYKYTVAGELYGKSTEPIEGDNVCMSVNDLDLNLRIYTVVYIDPKTKYLISYRTRTAPNDRLCIRIDQLQKELKNFQESAQNESPTKDGGKV